MGLRQRFTVPDGCILRGFLFEVEPTSPGQPTKVAQAFGARRYAHNWALGQVKANLDARKADPSVPRLSWNAYELRKAWNHAKEEVAPWWRCASKEAYASGIADLVAGLHNWSDAKAGCRKGPRVGFPRFKARHRDRGRVRFTTGAMRLEPDRRHLVLPVIGKLRSKERTRRLERLVAKGRARILSMTLSERGGRLVVAVQALVTPQPRRPGEPDGRCGVDLGIGQEWAVVAHADDTVERVAHPAPWKQVAQAGIGRVRPTLAYKCPAGGGELVVADRWFASSKRHHGCGGYLADLRLDQRVWVCPGCGQLVDRNANAALNLRDWTEAVSAADSTADRDVQRGGVAAPVPLEVALVGDRGGQAHVQAWACEVPEDHHKVAGAGDTRTDSRMGGGTPSRGADQPALTNAH